FPASAPEASGHRVKVYDRGEALAGGVKFQLRRPLAQRQVVFARQALIGGQDEHPPVTCAAKLLQEFERGNGEEHGGRGQAVAVALENAIPRLVSIAVRGDRSVAERELQAAQPRSRARMTAGGGGGYLGFRDLPVADHEGVLGETVKYVVRDDDQRIFAKLLRVSGAACGGGA